MAPEHRTSASVDYFAFFNIPVTFRIDEEALRRAFYANSKKFHPDFHTLADEAEQEKMLELATLNNEAFKTLSDPDQRIRYILELKGMLGEEDQQPQLPQEFLLSMMDINENLMELEFDYDEARFQNTLSSIESLEKELWGAVSPVLQQYAEPDHPEGLELVKEYFLKKRYLLRIRENLSKFAPR